MSDYRHNTLALSVEREEEVSAEVQAEHLEALIRRDPQACLAFWQDYSPLVRGVLRTVLSDRSEAHVEDMVQNVFVCVFERLRQVQDPTKLRSFVVGVAMNLARNDVRRHRRWLKRLVSVPSLPTNRSTPPLAPEQLAVQRLFELLDRLKPESRMVLVLRYLEQMEISEIAETLEISQSTVKRRVRQARTFIVDWARRDTVLSMYVQTSGEHDG